jgi:hydroxypyruvate isomerase
VWSRYAVIRGVSANLNTIYANLDELDRGPAAVRDGFRCVEMWAPPAPVIRDVFIDRLRHLDLRVASVNTPAGPADDDFGVAGDPSLVGWWRREFVDTLDFARQAEAGAINVLVGGRRTKTTPSAQWNCLLDNVLWALGQRKPDDPILLLEPLNRVDRRLPLLKNVEDVTRVLESLGRPPGLRMLFDAYHLFQEEEDLLDALRRSSGTIGHVQLADSPGRGEPGSGELPVNRLLSALASSGFDGWIGLEYFPTTRSTAFAWLSDYAELDDRLVPGMAL